MYIQAIDNKGNCRCQTIGMVGFISHHRCIGDCTEVGPMCMCGKDKDLKITIWISAQHVLSFGIDIDQTWKKSVSAHLYSLKKHLPARSHVYYTSLAYLTPPCLPQEIKARSTFCLPCHLLSQACIKLRKWSNEGREWQNCDKKLQFKARGCGHPGVFFLLKKNFSTVRRWVPHCGLWSMSEQTFK